MTETLDEGPIVKQDGVRVDHRQSVEDLTRLGADVERAVLSRAVLSHCEDRVIRYANQTIVFYPRRGLRNAPEIRPDQDRLGSVRVIGPLRASTLGC